MGARYKVVVVGKGRCDWADEAVGDYARRLQRHGGVTEMLLRPEPYKGDVSAVQQAEGERIIAATDRDRLVALDERGDRISTEAFAALVDEGRQLGSLAFAIGGPYGHDPSVRAAAWRTVRLSDLVLNHQLARVILYEQLYRAATLIAGVPYHH